MADWKEFNLEVSQSIAPITQGITSSVGGITTLLGSGITVLDTLSNFLPSSSNPLTAAVSVLRSEILSVLEDLQQTGVYGLFLTPNSIEELSLYRGGFDAFKRSFISSMYDFQDLNRPQISASGVLGGVVLYISSTKPQAAILNAGTLQNLFNRKFSVALPAPTNFTSTPVYRDASTQSTLKALTLDVLTGEVPPANTLLLEWQEPRLTNGIFYDLFEESKFLLERSHTQQGNLLLAEAVDLSKETPLSKRSLQQGISPKVTSPLLDSRGRQQFYWEPFDAQNPFIEVGDLFEDTSGVTQFNFLSGSYAYLAEVPVGVDAGYYYRVRAIPQDATLESSQALVFDGRAERQTTIYKVVRNQEVLPIEMTPASNVIQGILPDLDTSFDLLSALTQVYKAAYLLRFDQDVYNPQGDLTTGSGLLKQEIPQELVSSLTTSSYSNDPGDPVEYVPGPMYSDVPSYQESLTNSQEDLVAKASEFDPFGGVDEFLLPSTSLSNAQRLGLTLDRLCVPIVQRVASRLAENDPAREAFSQAYLINSAVISSVLTQEISVEEFSGQSLVQRNALSSMLQRLEGFSAPGLAPNWESLKILDDLFPETSEILARIQTLAVSFEDALKGATDEMKSSIQGIEDRINILNQVIDRIDLLTSKLESYVNLDFDLDFLYIPPAVGGTEYVIEEIINAGNPPDRDPEAYFSSIVLLAGASDISEIAGVKNALSFLFGV